MVDILYSVSLLNYPYTESIHIRIGNQTSFLGYAKTSIESRKGFCKKNKELRKDQSQVEFSKRIGVAQSTLNTIENCEQSVTLHLIEKIAEHLKIKIQDLVSNLI